jgi:hypothetical protein
MTMRPLHDREVDLLRGMLSLPLDGADVLRDQIRHLQVKDEFTDESGSVHFASLPAAVPRVTKMPDVVLLEAQTRDTDGGVIQIRVHVRADGSLLCLERYRLDGKPILSWSAPADLVPLPRDLTIE